MVRGAECCGKVDRRHCSTVYCMPMSLALPELKVEKHLTPPEMNSPTLSC